MIAMFFISMAIHAVVFFINWKKMVLNEEALKREKLALQYESLKNQVNPHFLFNSLNVLTSLVYKDADMAARFIKQLSEVYRYVLDQKDKELVTLDDEMEFVNNFISLQKIRFDNSVAISINVPSNTKWMVIPLSIQMLVENAFKHNIASDENPLNIIIFVENDYISIKNNIQRKNVIKDSSNIGLANIKARYDFLSNKPCEIIDDGQNFIVELPLIAM
jgi:LytS/YehU family sensor histidine kinase